ncbi:MAG: ATP-binding protein [Fibrobacterota bacterium]|nr:ATP-binding protein [Fibrobacterota bacterium]
MIPRQLESVIKSHLHQKRAIVVLGPRRVGKTTLMQTLFDPARPEVRWFNGEEVDTRQKFATLTADTLKISLGDAKIIVIDEAQRIDSIGLVVKILVDKYPELQILVTGSSALELADGLFESMTGRSWNFPLYPLSFEELAGKSKLVEALRLLPHRMIYGFYPNVVTSPGQEQKILINLCEGALYKDVLNYQQLKRPALLEKLLQALALQLGSEVSFHELGQLIQSNPETVERYIDLLEKAFVLFRLPALSRNRRNEIKRGRKIYFLDNGVRNALIQNFAPLTLRNDVGGLWENFCIVERMKTLAYHGKYVNRFFWRTHTQQKIDYIEEYEGKLHAYEFKWNPKAKTKIPKSFLEAYPGTEVRVITPDNFHEFAIIKDEWK